MEVGSDYGVPGETSCCACFEARSVIDEIGGGHFQELRRESMRLSVHRDARATQNPKYEYVIDCGLGPMSNDTGD